MCLVLSVLFMFVVPAVALQSVCLVHLSSGGPRVCVVPRLVHSPHVLSCQVCVSSLSSLLVSPSSSLSIPSGMPPGLPNPSGTPGEVGCLANVFYCFGPSCHPCSPGLCGPCSFPYLSPVLLVLLALSGLNLSLVLWPSWPRPFWLVFVLYISSVSVPVVAVSVSVSVSASISQAASTRLEGRWPRWIIADGWL